MGVMFTWTVLCHERHWSMLCGLRSTKRPCCESWASVYGSYFTASLTAAHCAVGVVRRELDGFYEEVIA